MTSGKDPMDRQVYNQLKLAIQSDYSVGDLLPTITDLEQKFHTSRITIRNAIQMLADEGYVNVKQGRGTTVSDPRANQRINYLTSTSETLRDLGYVVRSDNVMIDTTIPPKNILRLLDLPDASSVYLMQRLLLADEKPVSIVTNYIVPRYVPDFPLKQENFKSLYQLLENSYGIVLDSGIDTITARSASMAQASLLKIPINSPLLHICRITYSQNKPVTYDDLLIDASRYKFSVSLAGRPAGGKQ